MLFVLNKLINTHKNIFTRHYQTRTKAKIIAIYLIHLNWKLPAWTRNPESVPPLSRSVRAPGEKYTSFSRHILWPFCSVTPPLVSSPEGGRPSPGSGFSGFPLNSKFRTPAEPSEWRTYMFVFRNVNFLVVYVKPIELLTVGLPPLSLCSVSFSFLTESVCSIFICFKAKNMHLPK